MLKMIYTNLSIIFVFSVIISNHKINSQQILKQKCAQYAHLIDSILNPTISFDGSKKFNGLQVFDLVGGIKTKSQEFPHMVALGYGPSPYQWKCGGTLISKNFVLTAAHCTEDRELGTISIARLGATNLINPFRSGAVQDMAIKTIVSHPKYQPPSHYNDIALLQLVGDVKYSRDVLPACIYTERNLPRRSVLTALGWGHLDYAGSASMKNLMKVDLNIFANNLCKKSYQDISKSKLSNGVVDAIQICAGGGTKDQPRDTCQGDSGGPLEIFHRNIHAVVGITSFGKACGVSNVPGVYTRISAYSSWIERNVWM